MGMSPLQEQRIKCWNRQVVLTNFDCKNKASSGLDNFITETQQELDPIEINLFSQFKSGYQKTFLAMFLRAPLVTDCAFWFGQ